MNPSPGRAVALLTVLISGASVATSMAEDSFQVIVHPSSTVTAASRKELSSVFLKRTDRLGASDRVVPLDLTAGSPTRAAFSRQIHGRAADAVMAYWQQQIFSGRMVPPPVRTEAEVLAEVRRNPAAVAYVNASVPLEGVKAVRISE